MNHTGRGGVGLRVVFFVLVLAGKLIVETIVNGIQKEILWRNTFTYVIFLSNKRFINCKEEWFSLFVISESNG